MVETQLCMRGITDNRVLAAMSTVPRHLFVEEVLINQAYADSPLPIGERQTISQPYIVALMTEALEITPSSKVLEIGTGCGYQTAILAELSDTVYSVERVASLSQKARKIIDVLGYTNILLRVGDGTYGWSEEAPFDAIIVTAGAPRLPTTLKKQLAVGGRCVIPIGSVYSQTLMKYTRQSDDPDDLIEEDLGGCRFVKLIGVYGWKKE